MCVGMVSGAVVAQVMREGAEQGQGGSCKENGQDELTVRAEVAQDCHIAFLKHWLSSRQRGGRTS